MHRQFVASRPRFSNYRGVTDVYRLLDHVQLAQAIVPLLLTREPGQLALVCLTIWLLRAILAW